MSSSRTAVVIPAAGSGTRTGRKTLKPLLSLGSCSILEQTVAVFARHRSVGIIQPVVPSGKLSSFTSRLSPYIESGSCLPPVAGGKERQDSVLLGISALPDSVELIIVHDAARPFVDPALVSRVIKAASRHGAALAAIPVQDTVKKASREGTVAATVDRSSLWLAQTPQAFRAELIRDAHRQAREEGYRGTDDASLVEKYGHPVLLVPGSPLNIKITTPEDIVLARALAEKR